MDKLFGISMDLIMVVLLAIFLGAMAVVGALAWRNRVMVKLGLRNIPRRRGQTALIIIGVMLSTVIVAAAFGTGDTLSYSIRHETVKALGNMDLVIFPVRSDLQEAFGSAPHISRERLQATLDELAQLDGIDGLVPLLQERSPSLNPRTSLTEGGLKVVGVDPETMAGFLPFRLTTGPEAHLEELGPDEAYLNDAAAIELEAVPGDEVTLFLSAGPRTLLVKGVVERNSLAGRDPTLVLPLHRAQELFDRPGQTNAIIVSIQGGQSTSAKLSKEVAIQARIRFNNPDVATQLHTLLAQQQVLDALDEETASVSGKARDRATQFRRELQESELSEQLNSMLADQEIMALVLRTLEREELQDVERQATTLFQDIADFYVIEVKRVSLEEADTAGDFATSFFMSMGMFSIVLGLLLIFLIFVMLAAARRSEMGMARAVGAKRRHMVQMFLFEGTAYALASAAVGVALGLGVSALIVTLLNKIFSGIEQTGSFQMTTHFALRTIVVSYCLGMVITFATVAVSANQVSRLNIVAAVRGLPNPINQPTTPWRTLLAAPLMALLLPFRHLVASARALFDLHPVRAVVLLLRALWAVAALPWNVAGAVAQTMARLFMQGWPSLVLGSLLAYMGATVWQRDSLFSSGISLALVGLGLMVRMALSRARVRPDLTDRIAFTFMGVTILTFWMLPVSIMKALVGELQGDIDMVFVSGIFMVASAVWTVMYNSDLLLRAVAFITSPIGRLRPVLVTAVAYPMSSKFRTGLTLAMFALVIFTLVVMSILTDTFSTQFADSRTVFGGWQIEGRVNPTTPIDDVPGRLQADPSLNVEDFQSIGGYTRMNIGAREVGAEQQTWEHLELRAADDAFLTASEYEFKLIAEGYGDTAEDVWAAMLEDPTLAVLGGDTVRSRAGAQDWRPDFIESAFYSNDSLVPFEMEVREPRTGTTAKFTVIGILDRHHEAGETVLVSREFLESVAPFPVPVTNLRFMVTPGADAARLAKALDFAFLEHGMDAVVLEEELAKAAETGRSFLRLFIGFMALGLVVGIAALGVVSTRAAVERRQQIGVLRAIGYRRAMILLSFLLESSFISLLGIAIGASLGTVLGYQAYVDISQEESASSIRFSIPWIQIGVILGLTYIFSLAATFLPARQASRVFPAEALRYE